MNLRLERKLSTNMSTSGELSVDGLFQCFTLERNAVKIPAGSYKITFYDSPSRHCVVPLLHDVPGRTDIEIHPGNYPQDSLGCILVGKENAPDFVGRSREAFKELMSRIQPVNGSQETQIQILDLV